MVEFPSTFTGPNTQNLTASLTNLTATAVGFIPRYGTRTMVMTEFVGTGIVTCIINSGLTNYWMRKTFGGDTAWLATCAVNCFVYTITTVMMGTSSGIFNPAVMFAWAILGRVSWLHWFILIFVQVAGALAGVVASYTQFTQILNRVPIPRKGQDGKWLYMQLGFRWRWMHFREGQVWGPLDRPWFTAKAPSKWDGGARWGEPEFWSDDVGVEPLLGGATEPESEKLGADSEAPGANLLGAVDDLAVADWVQAGWSTEEARLAASEEFQKEVRADRRRKLLSYVEVPFYYSPAFINCWWPHIMAGTTLCHWLSFMTGNATQLTNTNMYLTQPVSAPGSNYAFLNAVLLAWLIGLAYFLLTASASGICTLQLNPAADLGGRIAHFLLPIPNKGHSGWSYSWVPSFFPFVGAVLGACLMYMGMWSHLSFPFLPYGDMPHWY